MWPFTYLVRPTVRGCASNKRRGIMHYYPYRQLIKEAVCKKLKTLAKGTISVIQGLASTSSPFLLPFYGAPTAKHAQYYVGGCTEATLETKRKGFRRKYRPQADGRPPLACSCVSLRTAKLFHPWRALQLKHSTCRGNK